MTALGSFVLLTTAALVSGGPLLAEAPLYQESATVADREACVVEHFGDPQEPDQSISRSLVVRMIGEAGTEWQAALRERGEDEVTVEVISARNGSVRDQLGRLRERFPKLSIASLCERITVCRESISDGELADAATKLLDETSSHRFPLVSQTPFFLDERVYEVWATSFPNTSYFWLTAPSTRPTDDPLASLVFRVVRQYEGMCRQKPVD